MSKQTSLRELIKGVVEGHILTGTSFSLHDLTTSVRALVNSGVYEIPALAIHGQPFNYYIDHDDVKVYFYTLDRDGEFSQPLNRTFDKTHFVFSAANVVVAKSVAPEAVDKLVAALRANRNSSITTIKLTGQKVTPPQNTQNKLERNEVVKRVRTYQTNCRFKSFTPTTKQIQSAIKRGNKSTGWTRSELKQIWQGISDGRI